MLHLIQSHGWDYLVRLRAPTRLRVADEPQPVRLGSLLSHPGAPGVLLTGWLFLERSVWAQVAAVWRTGHQEPWLLASSLDLGFGLVELYARRMHIEAMFRDTKSGAFEWELSRVHRADRAQRLLLAIMLAIWCAMLLGEAARRAGEIPAYGRRAHAVSLVRRGLDWLRAPPSPRCFQWTLRPLQPVRI